MDTQKYIPFLIVSATIFFVLDLYFILSLTKFLKKNYNKKWFYKSLWLIAGLIAATTGYTLWLRSTNQIPSNFEKFLFALPAVWYLPKALITPILVVKDLFFLIRNLFRKKKIQIEISQNENIKSRRKFLETSGWSLAGIPVLMVADGLIRTTSRIQIKSVTILIKNLSFAHEGLKIVQITDVHAGSFSSPKMMQDLVWMVRMLQPDLLFVTGDFVNFNPKELPLILPQLASLSSKYGVFGCLGNHDHYMSESDHSKLIRMIENASIKLLINTNITLEINGANLQIAGVDNSSYRQSFGNFDKALSGLDQSEPIILLCHDPTNWDKEIRRKRPVDLTVSGHTHGGQIEMSLPGITLNPAGFVYKQYAGLYSDRDQHLYISAGIGTVGPPVRIGVHPELTVITLKSPEKFA